MTSDKVTVSRVELANAIQQWEAESKENNWPDRDDPERFLDSADYLFSIIKDRQG